jgi:hypothetical protein
MVARQTVVVSALAWLFLAPQAARCEDQKEPLPPFFFTLSSSRSEGPEGVFGVCNGAVLFEKNRPVACFGVNKRPNDKGRFVYLLLFRTTPGEGISLEVQGSTRTSTDETDSAATLVLDKKAVEVAYKFKADEKTHALLSESLKVGGKEVKEGEPRVFLVDLRQDKVTYKPVKVELPDASPYMKGEGKEEWVAATHKAIDHLKATSPEIKKFLEENPQK